MEQPIKESQLQQALMLESFLTLTGSIAHDLNNLLTGIQGNTSLMLLEVDAAHHHYPKLKRIEQSIQSCADLIQRLLNYAGGGEHELKPTDLNEILRKSSEVFDKTKDNIMMHSKYQKNIWMVDADQGQIEQVLLNLYVHASHSMPAGGELYLQTENVTLDEFSADKYGLERGGYVKISLTDTGKGIEKASRQPIIESLSTIKELDLNTEIGLASALSIIQNHAGMITVYSEKGQGTTFNIYLPISKKEFIAVEELAEKLSRGSETILLVDDEEMIIDVGIQMLEKLGYKVFTAGNGKAAIDIYKKKKEKIDLVILDVIMPGMGGGETYDRLKEINPNVNVLLASGYGINRQINEILARGCNGFIQKPFHMKLLSRKIREILDRK